MSFLGKAIEKTPVGDLTPIDEALQDASKGIGDFNKATSNTCTTTATSTREFQFEPDAGKRKRFERLQRMDCYDELIGLLVHYVRKTIPAPADTAGTLPKCTTLYFDNIQETAN